jgi:hypothetical protein
MIPVLYEYLGKQKAGFLFVQILPPEALWGRAQ